MIKGQLLTRIRNSAKFSTLLHLQTTGKQYAKGRITKGDIQLILSMFIAPEIITNESKQRKA